MPRQNTKIDVTMLDLQLRMKGLAISPHLLSRPPIAALPQERARVRSHESMRIQRYINILVAAGSMLWVVAPGVIIRRQISNTANRAPSALQTFQATAQATARLANTRNSLFAPYRERMLPAIGYLHSELKTFPSKHTARMNNNVTAIVWNGKGKEFEIGKLYKSEIRFGFYHYDMYVGNNLMAGIGLRNPFTLVRTQKMANMYSEVHNVDYIPNIEERVIRMMASIILSKELGYSITNANCQHYSVFAATGKFRSPDIELIQRGSAIGIPGIVAAKQFRNNSNMARLWSELLT